jgi:hypothetical protein
MESAVAVPTPVEILRAACVAVGWEPPEVGSIDAVAEWVNDRCRSVRNLAARKKATKLARDAIEAARAGDDTACRILIVKAAFWHSQGDGAFSMQRAEDPEIKQDEAK